MKRKTARRFAERLYEFLDSAENAEIVDRNGVSVARIHIPSDVQGLETAELFAGYVQADRANRKDKADVWEFTVTDAESNEDVVLTYLAMEKEKTNVYFLFTIGEETDDSVKSDEEEKLQENEQVRSG